MTDGSGQDRPAPDPTIDALSILAFGSAGLDQTRARAALGLQPSSTDEQFAHALVERAAQATLPALHATMSSAPPRQTRDSSLPPRPSRPSLPPRIGAIHGPLGVNSRSLHELDNLHTLLLIARAAGLFMRRAAVARIGSLLNGADLIAADQRRQTIDALRGLGHAELAFDVGAVLASLPGVPPALSNGFGSIWLPVCSCGSLRSGKAKITPSRSAACARKNARCCCRMRVR
jgi:hypothetical protein